MKYCIKCACTVAGYCSSANISNMASDASTNQAFAKVGAPFVYVTSLRLLPLPLRWEQNSAECPIRLRPIIRLIEGEHVPRTAALLAGNLTTRGNCNGSPSVRLRICMAFAIRLMYLMPICVADVWQDKTGLLSIT